MEDLGTLESFLPTMSNSPIISKAVLLQTFYNSIGSEKTTPTPEKYGKVSSLTQRLDLKSRDYGKFLIRPP